MMNRLIIVWAIGLVISFSGCSTMTPANQTIKVNPSNVRVSGDINMAAISRQ
jgi:hypothetical protein